MQWQASLGCAVWVKGLCSSWVLKGRTTLLEVSTEGRDGGWLHGLLPDENRGGKQCSVRQCGLCMLAVPLAAFEHVLCVQGAPRLLFMRAFAHLFEGKPSGLNTVNILRNMPHLTQLRAAINQTVIDDFTAAREAVRVSCADQSRPCCIRCGLDLPPLQRGLAACLNTNAPHGLTTWMVY